MSGGGSAPYNILSPAVFLCVYVTFSKARRRWRNFGPLVALGRRSFWLTGKNLWGLMSVGSNERWSHGGSRMERDAVDPVNKLWYLSQINLFEDLPMDDLKMIDAMAPMHTIPPGTIIVDSSEGQKNLYLLKKGRVRLFKTSEDGKQLTLGLLGKGNIFGETESISTGSEAAAVEALEETLVCVLSKVDFDALLLKWPAVAVKMVAILSQRLREAEELVENLAFRDVRYRVLYLLTKLARQFGTVPATSAPGFVQLDLRLSHQDLAHMIGSTRESVSMVLGQLAREGIVITGRKHIAVDEPRALALIDTL